MKNEEFVNEQDEGDTYLGDSYSDKDEDDFVKRMKENPNSKLNDAIKKFPEKQSFRIFKEKMTNIIVEEKTKNTTLFEFPCNEIGVEDKDGNGDKDNENDRSQLKNEGIKNDGDNNQKEDKDGKIIEDENDEPKNNDESKETNNHGETIQQSENENLFDKVVDNIMDNVLGIGFLSLNRSLMTRSKSNTPISQVIREKGKSEGVHKQGEEVEKRKGDDMAMESLNMEIKEEQKLRTQKMEV
uniref:Uncharacterized protein n=1 Tax=Lactuca sativa TaxID=4236 RepID=A0A9R1WQ51_LACSA|nr:hypothetical protein LSAT_V11C100046810 [Lactuca sativa]